MGGNETYAGQLVCALAEIDRENEYRLYVTNDSPQVRALVRAPNFTLAPIAPLPPWIRIPLLLPLELARHPVDVLHIQYIAPPCGRTPIVNTVHDLSHLHRPDFYPRAEVWRQRVLLRRSLARSSRVLASSQYTRADIMRTFALAPDHVIVTYLGVSDDFTPVGAQSYLPVLKRHGIRAPYLLVVGNVQPRKNLPAVLDAFAQLKREDGLAMQLVIVGRLAWRHDEVLQKAAALGLGSEVLFTASVPAADLPALYSGAAALIHVSLFEGFGLPPLEAMRCGTPVVVSNGPPFDETLGDAAVRVDPTTPSDIARGIREVLVNGQHKRALVQRGLSCAARFTWAETAGRTLAAYEAAVRSRRTPLAPRARRTSVRV
jgi:glycosyltransferase involved in cell wall biosynthesis